MSQEERRTFLTVQTAKFTLIRLKSWLLALLFFTPRRTFFPFAESGGKRVKFMLYYASTSESTFCKFRRGQIKVDQKAKRFMIMNR